MVLHQVFLASDVLYLLQILYIFGERKHSCCTPASMVKFPRILSTYGIQPYNQWGCGGKPTNLDTTLKLRNTAGMRPSMKKSRDSAESTKLDFTTMWIKKCSSPSTNMASKTAEEDETFRFSVLVTSESVQKQSTIQGQVSTKQRRQWQKNS